MYTTGFEGELVGHLTPKLGRGHLCTCICTHTPCVSIINNEMSPVPNYHKRRKLYVDFIRAIHVGTDLPKKKNLHTYIFVHKNTHK